MKRHLPWLIFFCFLLCGCSERWEGFVYPNKHDLTKHIGIGSYETLETCRASSLDALQKISSVERGDYECGLNCKADDHLDGMKICEDTLR